MNNIEVTEKEGFFEVKAEGLCIEARIQYTAPSDNILAEISQAAGVFDYNFDKGDILAYKGVIYTKNALPFPKFVHECVHLLQQSKWPNLALFLQNYSQVTKFRLGIELEAYRAEYQEAKNFILGGEIEKYIWSLAADLAGRYKLDINRLQAYQLIKKKN